MKKLLYNFCFLYSFDLFSIVKMQTNNTLILADNNFVGKKKLQLN